MEKDLIFLGVEGITDTTASRIADSAKLAYTGLETEIESISFINKFAELMDTDPKTMSLGVTDVTDIPAKIERIGQLKALDAWLREGVKAHQNLITETKRITISKYAKMHNITIPVEPSMEPIMTEDDVLASFDIKKRNRYYTLEAQAATIGKFIHKNESIDKARKEFYNKLANPRSHSGDAKDMVLYSFTPSLPKEEVENLFYKLKDTHAKYQSELNSIKGEIKSRIANDEIDKSKAYKDIYQEWATEYKRINNDYTLWQQEERKRVQNLKIVIPNALKDIFNEIAQLGKSDD